MSDARIDVTMRARTVSAAVDGARARERGAMTTRARSMASTSRSSRDWFGARGVMIALACAVVLARPSAVLASDYHADGALAIPYESRAERAMKARVSLDETAHTRTTARGTRVEGEDLAARARLVLNELWRRRTVAARDAVDVDERKRAERELDLIGDAIEAAKGGVGGDGGVVDRKRFAALGYSGEAEDAWGGSGGLMESIERRGGIVPGAGVRRAGPSKPSRSGEEEELWKFMSARRKRGGNAKRGFAAKERLAPAAPWFKPKQPEVYWDVDLEKIQRARESVEAKRKETDDFDFEITDMPIKALANKRHVAALGEARGAAQTPDDDKVDDKFIDVKHDAMGELLRGAQNSTDNTFSEKVEEWTRAAALRLQNATRSAKETIETMTNRAMEVEQELFMKHVDVRMFVDFADPFSLEFMLGAFQQLSSEQLGPVKWNIVPFVNVGQERNVSANCAQRGNGQHLSCNANTIAACALKHIGTVSGGTSAFTSCYAMQLLKLEAQDALKNGRQQATLSRVEERCCAAVSDGVVRWTGKMGQATQLGSSTENQCAAQKQCVTNGAGLELLSLNNAELGNVKPEHRWLPWVTVDGKAVCEKKCNLQASIRRSICEVRTQLPDGCPKFPWKEAWYDEPEISFGGLVAASAAILLAATSIFVLMREAGLQPFALYKEPKNAEQASLLSEQRSNR